MGERSRNSSGLASGGVELFLANCTHYPKRTGGAGDIFLAIAVVDCKAGALLYLLYAIYIKVASFRLARTRSNSILGPVRFFGLRIILPLPRATSALFSVSVVPVSADGLIGKEAKILSSVKKPRSC
jgi:hypothetical protein